MGRPRKKFNNPSGLRKDGKSARPTNAELKRRKEVQRRIEEQRTRESLEAKYFSCYRNDGRLYANVPNFLLPIAGAPIIEKKKEKIYDIISKRLAEINSSTLSPWEKLPIYKRNRATFSK